MVVCGGAIDEMGIQGRLRGIMANLVGAAGMRFWFAEIDHHLIPGPKLLEPKRPDFVI